MTDIYQIFNNGKNADGTEEKRQQMLAMFHNQEKEYEVKAVLYEDISSIKDLLVQTPDLKHIFIKLWKIIEENESRQKSRVRLLYNVMKIAGVILIGLFIGLYVLSNKSAEEPVYYSAHSPKGSVSEILLPDNTIIYLNADSHIRYSVDGKDGVREVFIDGEAWFDVTKNAEKPFVVHTSLYDVHVTGTRFNVKAYETENEIATTLEEGQVIIQSGEKGRIAKELKLKPGEQIILNKNTNELSVQNVETKWYTSWKENKLIFVNMDLKELVTLLERKYGVEIVIKSNEILNLHFDGTIKNESINEFLDIMENTLPISYKIVGQKIEIISNN